MWSPQLVAKSTSLHRVRMPLISPNQNSQLHISIEVFPWTEGARLLLQTPRASTPRSQAKTCCSSGSSDPSSNPWKPRLWATPGLSRFHNVHAKCAVSSAHSEESLTFYGNNTSWSDQHNYRINFTHSAGSAISQVFSGVDKDLTPTSL